MSDNNPIVNILILTAVALFTRYITWPFFKMVVSEWLTVPGSPNTPRKPSLLGKAVRQVRAATDKGKRVFVAETGGWPNIFEVAEHHYRLRGWYSSPDGMKQARQIAIVAAFAAGSWVFSVIAKTETRNGPVIVLAAISLLAGRLFFSVAHFVTRRLSRVWGPSLDIEFEGSQIEWTGYRRQWFGGNRREKIFAKEVRGQPRVIPHRSGPPELRKAQEAVRKGKKEPRMFYQEASEVLIDAGPAGSIPLKVAEFADDEHLEKGLQLVAGILIATAAAQGLVTDGFEKRKGAAPDGLF